MERLFQVVVEKKIGKGSRIPLSPLCPACLGTSTPEKRQAKVTHERPGLPEPLTARWDLAVECTGLCRCGRRCRGCRCPAVAAMLPTVQDGARPAGEAHGNGKCRHRRTCIWPPWMTVCDYIAIRKERDATGREPVTGQRDRDCILCCEGLVTGLGSSHLVVWQVINYGRLLSL